MPSAMKLHGGRSPEAMANPCAMASGHVVLFPSWEALEATHPETLTSMNNLGRLLRKRGKYEDAEKIMNGEVKSIVDRVPPLPFRALATRCSESTNELGLLAQTIPRIG